MRTARMLAFLLALFPLAAAAAIPTAERDALVALYQATGGSAWTDSTGWNGAAGTECSWFGVGCDENGAAVTSLSLPANNLVGPIPAKLASLTRLLWLDLSWNGGLTGPIGSQITSLANLESLLLTGTTMGGAIPASIGSMTKLRYLAIDECGLEGPIPAEIGQLTALEELWLDLNELTALPSSVASLVNLDILDVSGNRITGGIPEELGTLVGLQLLYLQGNQFSGDIPHELRTMVALRELDLSYNQLTGEIPEELGQLTALEDLDISANALSGSIPQELGNLTNLRQLMLYSNRLTGQIPAELYRLRALEELSLSANSLSGPIPGGIEALSSLVYFGLDSNQLTGPIPKGLGSIPSLVSIWLSDNQLSGEIPAELMNLSNLTSLSLGSNQLSGSIPSTIGNLRNLEELFLYNAGLGGSIPREIGLLTNLDNLYLSGNRFEGTIPGELAALTKLIAFHVGSNRLTGPIPEWIGTFTELRDLGLDSNQFSGPFPAGITKLTALEYLDLGSNRLTGSIPSDIGALGNLVYLSLGWNFFEGSIPAGLWTLTKLVDLRLDGLDLTGSLPAEVGNLTSLEILELGDMRLSGSIPPQIGNLASLQYLSLDVNRFTGTIPREIGNLSKLLSLDLSLNALSGPIPEEVKLLTALEAGQSDFDYNALYTSDASVAAFVDSKQYDGDFRGSQTVTPANLRVVSATDRSIVAAWTPIAFVDGDGGYRLTATPVGGSARVVTTTSSKEVDSAVIRGLQASTTYSITIAALSHPNGWQKNLVVSEESAPVAGTTGPPVVAPAEIALTSTTKGLIQIDGVAANEDSFTLTNFGDVASAITLQRNGEFFTIAPASFTLAGGASQIVTVKSVPSPVDGYWGDVAAIGDGVSEEMNIFVTLLSVARPSGTVVAEAVTARVEITGDPGTDSLGSASFRNTGTAGLSGVVTSDVPWLVPAAEQITIGPGETNSVNFTVMRSRRPPGAGESALTGILTLVYVDGSATDSSSLREALDGTTGVSKTLVTVVDVPKQKVTAGAIPALAAGEVAFFAPGIATRPGVTTTLVSDVGIANAYGTRAVDDLKIYYMRVGSAQVSLATLGAIAADASLTLANVIPNVYGATGAEVGTLQLRSSALDSLVVNGRLLNLAGSGGSVIGEMPILRSDRSAGNAEAVILTGVAKSASASTNLYVQETSGAAGAARVEMLDASGALVGAARDLVLDAFGTAELLDAAPAGAVTVVVTNTGTAGRIAAYARVSDSAGGDTWSIVDWSRNQQRVFRTAALRVPWVASSMAGGSSRRRLVRRGSSTGPAVADATAGSFATELWLHNPAATEALVELALIDTNGGRRTMEAALPARTTKSYADVVGSIAGSAATGSLEITPRRGSVTASARLRIGEACGNCGALLPVVPAGSGLRAGQMQRFSGIDGASAATIAARKPGTFRAGFGILETSGSPVRVRASLKLADGRSPVASVLQRSFSLGAGAAVTFDDLAAALYGDARGEADLHDLQVDFEVVEGTGSAVVWVTATDNATGDAIVRIE